MLEAEDRNKVYLLRRAEVDWFGVSGEFAGDGEVNMI